MKQKLRNTLVSSWIYYISDFITKLPPIGAGDNGGVIGMSSSLMNGILHHTPYYDHARFTLTPVGSREEATEAHVTSLALYFDEDNDVDFYLGCRG
jgi:hypothetical protein